MRNQSRAIRKPLAAQFLFERVRRLDCFDMIALAEMIARAIDDAGAVQFLGKPSPGINEPC